MHKEDNNDLFGEEFVYRLRFFLTVLVMVIALSVFLIIG
ncbi:hypothetical protein Phi46:3_gp055 [Cellulophaga phage phi46:3]|uniref:Uncharacterized protein n=1 Tax=Cellulophaga phage phi46:3 TaxID=1327985 RepID=R9ZZN6_9CAUD|nr:hypothetical protein Phi46:3_gp055 [Cellulophaga phage phi46:3]AGO48799.1 hypothetical protein Phi46:3_gp055 [Cellulophaga phage phi46:3]